MASEIATPRPAAAARAPFWVGVTYVARCTATMWPNSAAASDGANRARCMIVANVANAVVAVPSETRLRLTNLAAILDPAAPDERPVIIQLSSKDVIHSFTLPQMRVKQDAIPGTEQRVWFTPTRTGEWEIACSQLCGLGHYRMRGFYAIQTQADFDAWLSSQAGL